jgi:hypothetical protein
MAKAPFRAFYRTDFVPYILSDFNLTHSSRTVEENQFVDKIVISLFDLIEVS